MDSHEMAQRGGAVVSRWKKISGYAILGVTVFMWTFSNFLFSYLFADSTYAKPLFVTYINTASFLITIPFISCVTSKDRKSLWRRQLLSWDWKADLAAWLPCFWMSSHTKSSSPGTGTTSDDRTGRDRTSGEDEALISNQHTDIASLHSSRDSPLTFPETIMFAAQFSVLWVMANYFTAASFQNITVASGTAIASTSSLWTLLIGRLLHVEPMRWQKILGVLLSFLGIILILATDLFNDPGDNRGSFPEKSQQEIAFGSVLALISAIMYGCYGTFAKRSIGDETRANMPLVFGLVGVFNAIGLIPVMLIWHYTELESFELPPNGRVVAALALNAIVSVVSDLAWFYAVLITSPVVVTVVLSLTIPLSLVGQIFANAQYATGLNFLGSVLVTIACATTSTALHVD